MTTWQAGHMRRTITIIAVAAALFASACTRGDEPVASPASVPASAAAPAFILTSPDFEDGGEIPEANTASAYGGQCTGDNTPISLSWTGAPEGTVAYAVTMIDVDAGSFVHWLLADISGSVVGILPTDDAGATSGVHNAGGTGYFGPCPPSPDHHYVIAIYALDAELGLPAGFTHEELLTAVRGHVLASATLTGVRSGPA